MNDEYPIAKFVRLQNGDDIVAELVETEDEHGILYMVVNPLKVVYMQSQHQGYLSVSFIPWVFPKICDHQEFMLHADDVMLISNVSEHMNEYYWNNLESMVQRVDDTPPTEEIQDDRINEESLAEILEELSNKRTLH